MTQACQIGWVDAGACPDLTSIAKTVVDSRSERRSNLEIFLKELDQVRMTREASAVLRDAAAAIQEIVDPLP